MSIRIGTSSTRICRSYLQKRLWVGILGFTLTGLGSAQPAIAQSSIEDSMPFGNIRFEINNEVNPAGGTQNDCSADLLTEPEIKGYRFTGNQAFDEATLQSVIPEEIQQDNQFTYANWANLTTAINQFYLDQNYLVLTVQCDGIDPDGYAIAHVVEHRITEVQIESNGVLRDSYVRSRLASAVDGAVNVEELSTSLQLLNNDSLIEKVDARLEPGLRPWENILYVEVDVAQPFQLSASVDNSRSPSIGSIQRGVQARHRNSLGLGDELSVGYRNTDGSDTLEASYTLPINPRNGTISLQYTTTSSSIIEGDFTVLDIQSESQYYDLTFRQPLTQTLSEEFALGLTLSHRRSRSEFLEALLGEPVPFPSTGADAEGRTRVTALRFFQEWTQRSDQHVLALRSQFNVGLDLFDATINENAPDSHFLSWQGQAQWVRLLGDDALFLVRGGAQLSDRPLVPIEQFAFGGLGTVRGYRQDSVVADSGVFASAEVWIPVLRISEWDGVLQITPFIDFGAGWNSSDFELDAPTLTSLGLGLQWRSPNVNARLDYGIPLIDVDRSGSTLQEEGFHFSMQFDLF